MRMCEFDDDVVPPATWWHDGHDALTTATTETQLVEANGSVLSCERRMNAQTYMMRRLSRGTWSVMTSTGTARRCSSGGRYSRGCPEAPGQ